MIEQKYYVKILGNTKRDFITDRIDHWRCFLLEECKERFLNDVSPMLKGAWVLEPCLRGYYIRVIDKADAAILVLDDFFVEEIRYLEDNVFVVVGHGDATHIVQHGCGENVPPVFGHEDQMNVHRKYAMTW